MPNDEGSSADARLPRRRNLAILAAVLIIWLAADILSKSAFSDVAIGQTVGGPYLGIFQLTLVHNTGAAWGIFGDSTLALGAFSVVVCAAALVYMLAIEPRMGALGALGLSLVVAGGIGNAIDRFTLGYVVDFIEPVFIDFPVFNVADIGVTCGVVLFVASLLAEMVKTARGGRSNGGRQ